MTSDCRPPGALRRPLPVALLAATAAALTLAACNDPFAPQAALPVTTDSVALYAMTGTPPTYPSALDIYFGSARRIDPAYTFDLAFDIDADGKVRVIPIQLIGGVVTSTRSVGLQKITGAFDAVTSAPGTGYQFDSAMVLAPGEGLLFQFMSDACASAVSQLIYGKIRIIAANATSRALSIEQVLDPNCGFRSLAGGIPKN